ncbi:MAG: hypothetical protein QM756_34890 [Polyangiaceae bacterium]
MSTPTTSSRSDPFTPCSSKALAIMVVLDMAMMAPVNKLSIGVQPSNRPVAKPSHTIKLDCSSAVRLAPGPSFTSLPRLNSSPSENISRITPSSDSVSTTARSTNKGTGKFGPMMKPAKM